MSIIAVAGGKGAPGSTFVAINLAASIAAEEREALLLDLDPWGADVAACLGLYPRSGLYPLMRIEGKEPSLEAILHEAQVRDGLLAVAGFPKAEDVDLHMIGAVLDAVSESTRPVVVDLGRITPSAAHLFAKVESILAVVRPDMVGVYAARRAIQTLIDSGCEESRVAAVVNGWEWKRSSDLAETVEALSVRVIGAIPHDPREVRKALLDQRPLAKGRAFKAFRSLRDEVDSLMRNRGAVAVA